MYDKYLVVNLVESMISVNKWDLVKTYEIRDGLEENGLYDINNLNTLEEKEISQRLNDSGYARSEYIRSLIARNLHHMAKVLVSGEYNNLVTYINNDEIEKVDKLLLSIKGIGEHVLRIFKQLQNINS